MPEYVRFYDNKQGPEYVSFAYSEPSQRSKMERFRKIIMLFNYFCKKLHLKSLRGSEYVSGFHCVRVLNTGKFS